MIENFAQQLRDAAAAGRALRLRGGGSKDFYGQSLRGEVLDTRGYSGMVDYEPGELVLTARTGTPLREVEAALAERNQYLAFEPPHFAGGATLGGAVATGLAGPGRAYRGGVRDYLLGVRMLDGLGQDLRFGGRVMKNVAGFDVTRLMVGAFGTLGLLTEVTLKVLPRPAAEKTLRFEMPQAAALERLHGLRALPLPLSASLHCKGELFIRLSGASAAVDAAAAQLGGEAVEGAALWQDVRDHRHTFFAGEGPIWRLSLPATAAPLELAGEQLIEWGGALRWWRTSAGAAIVRAVAQRAGGHATLFRGGNKDVGVFQTLPPTLREIHAALRKQFDPHGILNPDRLYGGL